MLIWSRMWWRIAWCLAAGDALTYTNTFSFGKALSVCLSLLCLHSIFTLRVESTTGNAGVLDFCNWMDELKPSCTTNCFVNIGAVSSHCVSFRALQKLEIPLYWCGIYSRKYIHCEGCNFSLHVIWPGSLTLPVAITLLCDDSAFCLEPH